MPAPAQLRRGTLLAALALGLASPLPAQDVTIPGTTQDSSTTPTGPIGSNGSGGSADYQNVPATTILELYRTLSGKHMILDANLPSVQGISLRANGLNRADMLALIQSTLLLNGVAIIPVGPDTVKVITIGTNKMPGVEGVKVYANADDLPKDDEVVTYYMPLNYLNPQEAVGVFTQIFPVHTFGHYMPVQTAQAVVVTETVSTVKGLIALKELMDVPPARVQTEWVQLNRADAEKTADILNKMLGNGATGAPAAPAGPGGLVVVPPGLGGNAPLSNEKNLISGTALIIPDSRSNRLLVSSRPVNLPFLEQMIAQLDQADIFTVPQRRELKFVLANDILPALEAAIATGKDEEDQLKKDQQAAQTTQNGTGRPGSTATSQPTSTAGASSGGSGSVSAITPQLAAPNANNVPTVLTIGKTRLMADNRSNSIIVFGSPDVVARVFAMVDQLDRKPLQVYLRTVIGELTVSEGLEFGIDILQKFSGGTTGRTGLASSNLNSTATTTGLFPEPRSLLSAAGFPLPTGLTLYGAIGNTIDAYVRALETTDRFKIISTPSVYTSNNKLAVIASGSQVPVPSSTTSGFTGTTADSLTTTSSIAYEDVLLQLDIIPLINANHDVTLQIRQTNNSLGSNVDISGNEVPIINTQEINTEITVPDKATVVIGGLINDKTTRDSSGIPFLSDIPILGYLFGDVTKNKERDELIIMIEPSVVETDADQIAVNETEKQRTILGREAVEAATGVPPDQQAAVVPVTPLTTTQTTTQTTHHGIYSSKYGRTTSSTTTTTTIQHVPTQQQTPVGPTTPTGPVPGLSSPAPDVQNGKLPPIDPTTKSPPPSTMP
jgi:type II secretion system protein D